MTSWLVGVDVGGNLMMNLNFSLQFMYQHTEPVSSPAPLLGLSSTTVRSSQDSGKASALASKAVCASPVTSDRIPVSLTDSPERELRGFLLAVFRQSAT